MSTEPAPSVRARVAVALAALVSFGIGLWASDLLGGRWDVPITYSGDGLAVAAHIKTVLETGWYESQPALGAPAGQVYHDFPTADNIHFAAAAVLGWFFSSWGVVMNVHFLLGFPLAAASMAWFSRRIGVRSSLAAGLGVVYAIAPYHFARGEGHLFLSWYWVVPLGLVLVVRILRGTPLWGARPGMPRGLGHLLGRTGGTLAILVLLGSTSAYYAVFVALLGAVAAIGALIARPAMRPLLGAVAAGGALAATILVNMAPDLLYRMANGANPGALVRTPVESEIYGLKLVQLLLPSAQHRFGPFAELRRLYDEHYPIPSESPSLGIIGAVGLVALVVVAAVALAVIARTGGFSAVEPTRTVVGLAFLAVVALLLSWSGGLSTLISFVTTALRAWNRMSIVIAALALAGLGLLLQHVVARLVARTDRARRTEAAVSAALALVLVCVAVWDQVPAADPGARESTIASFDSDAAFVAALESALPPDAAIFQLPYIPFPESPPVGRALDSDQLRLYLHADALRFSGGGIRGREAIDRLADVADDEAFPQRATELGFVGVVVDSWADEDGAIAERLAEQVGRQPTIVSPDGRFAFTPFSATLER